MPFSIKRRKRGYDVITTETGKVHGHFKTKEKAKRQLSALYASGAMEKK